MRQVLLTFLILFSFKSIMASSPTECATILDRLAAVNSLAKTLYSPKMVEGFIDLTLQRNRPFPLYTIVATSTAVHRKLLHTYFEYLKKFDEDVLYYNNQYWNVNMPSEFLEIGDFKKVMNAKDKDTLYFSLKPRLDDLLAAIAKFRQQQNTRAKRLVIILSDINLTVNEAGQPSGVFDRWTAINNFSERARQYNVEVVLGSEKNSTLPTSNIYDIGGIRIIHF